MMRRLLILLATAFLLCANTPAQPKPEQERMRLLKLSLQVMLYNNDLAHAQKIVDKALQSAPEDPFWIAKAAQIALWRGETESAKRWYLKLYRATRDADAREELERLAHATEDQEIMMMLDEQALEKRWDSERAEKLYRAYYDTGYLERGAAFFQKLERRFGRKEAARAALLLEMEYAGFAELSEGYHRFKRRYGFDAELLYRYAKLLFARRAYMEAFIEIAAFEREIPPEAGKLWELYTDLALLGEHEETLLHLLGRREALGTLDAESADLYLRLLTRHNPAKALAYARKRLMRHPDSRRFCTFAGVALQQHAYALLADTLQQLPRSLLKELESQVAYWRIAAQLLAGQKAYDQAVAAWRKAITLDPDDVSLHAAYLWSLLDADDTDAMRRELRTLRERFGEREELAQPKALAWFRLGASQPALRQIRMLLRRSPDDWRTQLLYADILSLSGDEALRDRTLLKAWYLAQKALRHRPALFRDPSFCYDYTRLALSFMPLQRRRLLAKAAEVLSPGQITELWLSALDPRNAPKKVRMLLRRLPHRTPSQQLQLAMLEHDTQKIAALSEHDTHLPLWDAIVATKESGDTPRYLQRLFAGMEANPHNGELVRSYTEAVMARGPAAEVSLRSERRNRLRLKGVHLALHHNNQAERILSFNYRSERFDEEKGAIQIHTTHQSAAFTLYGRFKNYRMHLRAGVTQQSETYATLEAGTEHETGRYRFSLLARHNAQDDLNNDQLLYGRKSGLRLHGSYRLDGHRSVAFGLELDRHYENNSSRALGDSALTELSYTRYLRLGYPDLSYTLFTQKEIFRESAGILPQNYWQGGIRIAAGEGAAGGFHTRLKPWGGATLLYNNRTRLGYALHAGAGKRLLFRDYLGIEGTFASGIGLRREDYLSLKLRYLWW